MATEYDFPGAEEPLPEPVIDRRSLFSAWGFFLRLSQLILVGISAMLLCYARSISSEYEEYLSFFLTALAVHGLWSTIFAIANLVGVLCEIRIRNSNCIMVVMFGDLAMGVVTGCFACPLVGFGVAEMGKDIAKCNGEHCQIITVAGAVAIASAVSTLISVMDDINSTMPYSL